jgi:hypothetical protein
MTVTETVILLITNWPSLYTNRAEALKHIFTSSGWHWVDGALVPTYPDEVIRDELHCPLHQKLEGDLDERLRISKRNAIDDWTVANAAEIAVDERARCEHDCLSLSRYTNRFADMPDDVQGEWLEAARDTAGRLFYSTKNAEKGSHEYAAHRTLMPFMKAQGFITKKDVSARVAQLKAELNALEAD